MSATACVGEGPVTVCLAGEPGHGKTRLVQELYGRLAIDRQESAAYWPARMFGDGSADLLEARKRVHPRVSVLPGGVEIPWFWWGIACQRSAAGEQIGAHCWGGRGRTGTVVGRVLAREGHTYESLIDTIRSLRDSSSKAHYDSPEADNQHDLLRRFLDRLQGWISMIALAAGLTSLLVALASCIGLIWLSVAMFDDDPLIPFMVVALWSSIAYGIYRFVKGWRAETKAPPSDGVAPAPAGGQTSSLTAIKPVRCPAGDPADLRRSARRRRPAR